MCEIIPVPTFHPMIFNSMFYFCGTRSSRHKCISPVLSLSHAHTHAQPFSVNTLSWYQQYGIFLHHFIFRFSLSLSLSCLPTCICVLTSVFSVCPPTFQMRMWPSLAPPPLARMPRRHGHHPSACDRWQTRHDGTKGAGTMIASFWG